MSPNVLVPCVCVCVSMPMQGVQVLRALRKFMSSKLFTPAPQTPSLPHPLLRFTATPPRFEMPSSLALPRAASHNPDHMPLMEILAMRGSQSPRGAKGAKKGVCVCVSVCVCVFVCHMYGRCACTRYLSKQMMTRVCVFACGYSAQEMCVCVCVCVCVSCRRLAQ